MASERAQVWLNSSPPGIGKWEDRSMNAGALQQPGGSQSLDEWECVWCLRADLIYQKSHVRQMSQLYSQRPLFFFYIALIFGRHWRNLPRLDR